MRARDAAGRARPTTGRPPPWRDVRVIRVAFQLAVLALIAGLGTYLAGNLTSNLRRQGIQTSFDYLSQPAGFAIPDSDFQSSQAVWRALLAGVRNTAAVAVVGIAFATILGIVVGVARLSRNWLVRKAASLYVESLRNVPVLIIIFFFWIAVVLKLPAIGDAAEPLGAAVISNSGIVVPSLTRTGPALGFAVAVASGALLAAAVALWRTRRFDASGDPHHRVLWGTGVFAAVTAGAYAGLGGPVALSFPARDGLVVTGGVRLNPEFAALLVGLVVYTASHIAEIVRGSILAVSRGQSEAATALGLSEFQRLRFVVLPQAFRIAVPPIGNQYLNLTKNSSLAVAIGYFEITKVTSVVISQGNPAPQSIAVLMLIYLAFSLTISAATNLVNRRLQLAGR